jgi:alkylated DNA repair dioxygenase AlkB
VLRLRRKVGERKWERANVTAGPRTAYMLTGPARSEWEHSIPPESSVRRTHKYLAARVIKLWYPRTVPPAA